MEMHNIEVEDITCRICKCVTAGDDLIHSPCLCKGSLGYVHLSCLERWLNSSCRDNCELCCYQFQTIRVRRYNFLQSLRVWIIEPAHQAFIVSDVINVVMLTAFTLPISFLAFTAIEKLSQEKYSVVLLAQVLRLSIGVFLFLLVTSWCMTIHIISVVHFKTWYRWWGSCVDVKLILDVRKYQLQRKIDAHIVNCDELKHNLKENIENRQFSEPLHHV